MGQVGPRNILFKHRSMNIGNGDRERRQRRGEGEDREGHGNLGKDKEREVEHTGKRMKWGREYSNAEEKKNKEVGNKKK